MIEDLIRKEVKKAMKEIIPSKEVLEGMINKEVKKLVKKDVTTAGLKKEAQEIAQCYYENNGMMKEELEEIIQEKMSDITINVTLEKMKP